MPATPVPRIILKAQKVWEELIIQTFFRCDRHIALRIYMVIFIPFIYFGELKLKSSFHFISLFYLLLISPIYTYILILSTTY